MKQSVIQYVLSRLYQLGITDVFGVPGDYAFPINDAISEDQTLRWIGSSNELNAAYSADGYARIKGVAAVNTTYGVGELSALNAIAGAYAEHLPVFHLVGMPNTTTQRARALGCENWFTARVTTCGELDQAITHAEERDTGAYIEVVTDTYVTSPLAAKLHEARGTLYMH
jgi:thiamine pyrophosphate-dependent acetolactate synthase large subunit-like protein